MATLIGWQPIETAPKDGSIIDLLCEDGRWADCYWGAPEHCCGEAGQYCDSEWHGAPDGWVWSTMNEFLPSEEPPTHWMPVPSLDAVSPDATSAPEAINALVAALRACPLPSTMGNVETHYQRFYGWYNDHAKPALSAFEQEGRS